MVEHLSFEEVALELNCSISKVRQLVIQDKQLKATRFTTNGIELETTANDSHFPYDIDFCSHLSDEGKITSDVYEMGKTGITEVLDGGHLYIKRADLHTYITASGRAVGTEPVPSNNLATTIEVGSSPLSKKERDSLLELVIGMAIGGYRYDPTASKNTATADIVKDLADLGISIDAGTVLKYLNMAKNTVLPAKPRQS
jgi:reverse gyrase